MVYFVLTARAIVPHDASIPTKYQTIVLDNSDKKGFNSQARRFNDNLVSCEMLPN